MIPPTPLLIAAQTLLTSAIAWSLKRARSSIATTNKNNHLYSCDAFIVSQSSPHEMHGAAVQTILHQIHLPHIVLLISHGCLKRRDHDHPDNNDQKKCRRYKQLLRSRLSLLPHMLPLHIHRIFYFLIHQHKQP